MAQVDAPMQMKCTVASVDIIVKLIVNLEELDSVTQRDRGPSADRQSDRLSINGSRRESTRTCPYLSSLLVL